MSVTFGKMKLKPRPMPEAAIAPNASFDDEYPEMGLDGIPLDFPRNHGEEEAAEVPFRATRSLSSPGGVVRATRPPSSVSVPQEAPAKSTTPVPQRRRDSIVEPTEFADTPQPSPPPPAPPEEESEMSEPVSDKGVRVSVTLSSESHFRLKYAAMKKRTTILGIIENWIRQYAPELP